MHVNIHKKLLICAKMEKGKRSVYVRKQDGRALENIQVQRKLWDSKLVENIMKL